MSQRNRPCRDWFGLQHYIAICDVRTCTMFADVASSQTAAKREALPERAWRFAFAVRWDIVIPRVEKVFQSINQSTSHSIHCKLWLRLLQDSTGGCNRTGCYSIQSDWCWLLACLHSWCLFHDTCCLHSIVQCVKGQWSLHGLLSIEMTYQSWSRFSLELLADSQILTELSTTSQDPAQSLAKHVYTGH